MPSTTTRGFGPIARSITSQSKLSSGLSFDATSEPSFGSLPDTLSSGSSFAPASEPSFGRPADRRKRRFLS